MTSSGRRIFAVVVGDDEREYFTIPSLLRYPQAYASLRIGSLVEFVPAWTEKGWRATDTAVLSITPKDADGEETHLQS